MAATPAAALPDDLVEEIFLRLPPDEPACLLRASLISKAWGGAISSPAFRRRLHDFHRTPHCSASSNTSGMRSECPASSPPRPRPSPLSPRTGAHGGSLDCRHGRALFISLHQFAQEAQELLVWEPITGAQRRLPVPSFFESVRKVVWEKIYPGAAVFCAADGCDHRNCLGGPFGLVFVFTFPDDVQDEEAGEYGIWAGVFSSETGTWDKLTLVQSQSTMRFIHYDSVLVGRSLLYFMSREEWILQYDLASHTMTLLDPPGSMGRFNIMLTDYGGLGIAEYSDRNLKLWTKEARSDSTDAHWVLSQVINLVNLLPIAALLDAHSRVQVVAVAEGTHTIFLSMVGGRGTFIVDLQSEKARKVCDVGLASLVPVVSFYTPVPRGEHQDPPPSGPSEEAGCEEGGEEEIIVEQPQPQQLFFDKGSNALEEGDFVNTCFSHTLKTRVPSHGEVSLDCASTEYGCAMLYKAESRNNPLDDVPESASNEEFVTGTTSKNDARNSKTSGSNVEGSALPP